MDRVSVQLALLTHPLSANNEVIAEFNRCEQAERGPIVTEMRVLQSQKGSLERTVSASPRTA